MQPGDTVLVQAAASGVGTVLMQLCKQWGFRSIATASTEAKLALARSLGADVTINYTTQDFEAEVMRLTQGVGVQLALEAVGGDVTVKSMRCLAPFGMLVNYGNASNQPASLPLSSFREQRAAMGFSLPATFPHADNQAAMAEILDLLMANKVRLIVDQVLPLSEAAEAHARLSNRGAMGKSFCYPRLHRKYCPSPSRGKGAQALPFRRRKGGWERGEVIGSQVYLRSSQSARGMVAVTRGTLPTTRVVWPLPVRSSARVTWPGPKRCTVPSPRPISTSPARLMTY